MPNKNLDPTKQELLEFLSRHSTNDFDKEAAIYWFAFDYYDGMWSNLYRVMCSSNYSPGKLMSGVDDEGEEVRELYELLRM